MNNTVLNYDNSFETILNLYSNLPLELIEMSKTYYYMEKKDNGYEIQYGYTNDEGYFILHNDCDQPAVRSRSGHRWWYQHNIQHRDALPACILNRTDFFYKEWKHNGEFIRCLLDYSCVYE
jgi:hypothetical protein